MVGGSWWRIAVVVGGLALLNGGVVVLASVTTPSADQRPPVLAIAPREPARPLVDTQGRPLPPRPGPSSEEGPRPSRAAWDRWPSNSAIVISADGRTALVFPRRPEDERPRRGAAGPMVAPSGPAALPASGQTPPQNPPVVTATPVESVANAVIIRPTGAIAPGLSGGSLYAATLVAFLGVGVGLVALFPGHVGRVASVARFRVGRLARLLAVGTLSAVVMLLVSALLAVIVIGAPLVVAIAVGASVAVAFGMVSLAVAVGRRIGGFVRLRRDQPLAQFGLGALVLVPLTLLPWIGWIVGVTLGLLGLGAVVFQRLVSVNRTAE
ncbi:MAG: hypothetical protein NZ518_02280, partial [Dehalococcoidia bacterium]|nr:hypothetical protein [Dehalococcoidia bacterium]